MVKRKGGLFNRVCELKNIIIADKNARKNKKKSKSEIDTHDRRLLEDNIKLQKLLKSLKYKTSKYSKFKIYEPKEREIFKLPYYPDRITHHAIMNILKPFWTRQFIENTYSCIEGRGIHRCLKHLKKDLKRTKNSEETKYCLKLDIKKFYPSIDHSILKNIIEHKLKDKKLLKLLFEIIDSTNKVEGCIYGKGVPIGNYLSQYFANLYLTPFDHWCKEELKCRYYYRYADDIVILSSSKRKLRNILIAIKVYLNVVLNLKVKDNYQIFPVEVRGIDFVGYVIKHNFIKVRKSIKIRLKDKVSSYTYIRLKVVLPSYIGWLKHCNSRHLVKTLVQSNSSIIKIMAKKRTGRAKPMVGKAGITRSKTAYKCGGKLKK